MRKLFYILLLLLPMLSCVGQKDDPAQEVRLVADLTAINVTAGEQATFTVFSGAEDVTVDAEIRNVTDGTVLEGNVFAPTDAGEWTFVASIDGEESEPLVISAIVIADEGKDFYRRSLVLDFTGTWCVNCPKMEAAIEETMEARPGRIVPVSVHCMSIDPMYLKPTSDDLAKKFGVNAYPSAVVDMDPESLISESSPALLQSHIDRLLEARGPAAGLRIESELDGDRYTVKAEMTIVRDGDYTLSILELEDGIVAKQTGGSENHIHNNVLRSWTDCFTASGMKEGETGRASVSRPVSGSPRFVALVCRNGIVDNVVTCALGATVDYQYEEEND